MLDKILLDSRHKFVYFEEDERENISNASLHYPIVMDSEESILVYVKDVGLPNSTDIIGLNGYRIRAIHSGYYNFLIALSIVDTLMNKIDKNILNKRLKDVYVFCSMYSGAVVENIDDLRLVLSLCLDDYKSLYSSYLNTCKLDFDKHFLLNKFIIDMFIPKIKDAMGFKKCFSLLYDYDDKLSDISMMTINSYINTRYNGYLSINILCGNNIWNCYYDSFGNDICDYANIYSEKTKKKIRHI